MLRLVTFTMLFKPLPDQWGLRGDPFLWQAMARQLGKIDLPETEEQMIALVESAFSKLTGVRLPDEGSVTDDDMIFVKRYARGGMSSGQISMSFWRRSALPLLTSRFRRLRQAVPKQAYPDQPHRTRR